MARTLFDAPKRYTERSVIPAGAHGFGRRLTRAFFLLAITALLAPCQKDSGELRVTVKDAAGAPVPATAELVSQSAKSRSSVDLPPSGQYSFRNLPFGVYTLRVSRPGFSAATELIDVRSALPLTREITLRIQQVETAIEVRESATLIDP